MTKGEKRNCKIDLRDFLHGIVEHNFKERRTVQKMER